MFNLSGEGDRGGCTSGVPTDHLSPWEAVEGTRRPGPVRFSPRRSCIPRFHRENDPHNGVSSVAGRFCCCSWSSWFTNSGFRNQALVGSETRTSCSAKPLQSATKQQWLEFIYRWAITSQLRTVRVLHSGSTFLTRIADARHAKRSNHSWIGCPGESREQHIDECGRGESEQHIDAVIVQAILLQVSERDKYVIRSF